jgi:hypothetical protein
MTPKQLEYLAKAEQYEKGAKKLRNQEDREWLLCVARAYRMLAEAAETESMLQTDVCGPSGSGGSHEQRHPISQSKTGSL